MSEPHPTDFPQPELRALAWRRVLAWADDTSPQNFHPSTAEERTEARTAALWGVRHDQLAAEITDAELDSEELDIWRRHAATDDALTALRRVGRQYLAALQNTGPSEPPPGAEDYRSDGGTPL